MLCFTCKFPHSASDAEDKDKAGVKGTRTFPSGCKAEIFQPRWQASEHLVVRCLTASIELSCHHFHTQQLTQLRVIPVAGISNSYGVVQHLAWPYKDREHLLMIDACAITQLSCQHFHTQQLTQLRVIPATGISNTCSLAIDRQVST